MFKENNQTEATFSKTKINNEINVRAFCCCCCFWGGGVSKYMVCSLSIETEVVFFKALINQKVNFLINIGSIEKFRKLKLYLPIRK